MAVHRDQSVCGRTRGPGRRARTLTLAAGLWAGVAASAQDPPPAEPPASPPREPAPTEPRLPRIEELAERAEAREYFKQLHEIRMRHFGPRVTPQTRRDGVVELLEFTDPAAFRPLVEVFHDAPDDARRAVLNHLEAQGPFGQEALAYAAVYSPNETFRFQARRRLRSPIEEPVRRMLERALEESDEVVATRAAELVASLEAISLIPSLVTAQYRLIDASTPRARSTMKVGTERVIVAYTVPVVTGDYRYEFPVLTTVGDRTIIGGDGASFFFLRREGIHGILVELTTRLTGEPTAHLGYQPEPWRLWYTEVFLPVLEAKARATDATPTTDDEVDPGESTSDDRGDAGRSSDP